MRNPQVTVKIITDITHITSAKMYGELRWLKGTIGLLRFRQKGEPKNNEYDTELLQSHLHFTLKVSAKWDDFSNDGIKGSFC